MRILHVHTRYREPGGEDAVVEAERRLLSNAGYDVVATDFQNPTSTFGSLSAIAQAPWNRSAAERLINEAHRHSPDMVHIHNTWFALSPAAVVGLRRAGFPVVMTFHNYRLVCVNAMLFRDGRPCEICVGGSTLPGIRYRCYRGSLGASTMASATIQLHRQRGTWANDLSVAVALTEFAKERLLQGGLHPDRTVVKPNFVIDPGPRPKPPSASAEVLFVGRLTREKGTDRLLDAWSAARPEGLELVVIGSGPESDQARRDVPAVRFLGQLPPDEVRRKMLDSRALVVPSLWYEGQPMVILEALAAGLPVFHTDLGALGETSGKGGVSIGLGDLAGMASALQRLVDGELVDHVGRLGRFEFETRFSEHKSLEALRRIYELASG